MSQLIVQGSWIIIQLMEQKTALHWDKYLFPFIVFCLRPYHIKSTSSHLNTEVKQHRASVVPGWETTWELLMQQTFCQFLFTNSFFFHIFSCHNVDFFDENSNEKNFLKIKLIGKKIILTELTNNLKNKQLLLKTINCYCQNSPRIDVLIVLIDGIEKVDIQLVDQNSV